MAHIAPTATIESGASIGENVHIGDHCFISAETVIGNGTTIASHCHISGNVTIGENNRVFSHSVLGTEPQSLSYKGEPTQLIIGNGNTIREFTLFNRGLAEFGGKTVIGDDNYLMGYVHIGHDCKVGNRNIFANAATLGGHVEVGNHTNIGGMTPIHQFVKIGSYCMIGGASGVSQDIPHFCMAQGNHARIRGLNRHALRKHFTKEEIDSLYRAYKTLFSGHKPYKETAAEMLESNNNALVIQLCEFVLHSKRGIPFERKTHE